ncbi:MAG: prephenate dehydratase, partial [Chloroflexi bacterium]|nr:prephenate dehydratase [Chloroflexota bacterium]
MPDHTNQPLTIAYLGPPGTFTEQAASLCVPAGREAELTPYPSITASAEAAAAGRADLAVLPFENSLAGAVGETHDLIIHQLDSLAICDEIVIPIEHCLIAAPDADTSRVDAIYSHPQALGQCQRYLQRRFPDARTEATLSTSQAVARAVELGNHTLAIAPRRAAALHGAVILEAGIEDDHRNATRFVVLADHDHDPTGDDRSTILFSTTNRPGALLEALQCFAQAGINLTRIESRPSRERLGTYLFIVDCDGHRTDPPLVGALEQVAEVVERLRIVGSYPKAPRI